MVMWAVRRWNTLERADTRVMQSVWLGPCHCLNEPDLLLCLSVIYTPVFCLIAFHCTSSLQN